MTRAELQSRLQKYYEAETAILKNQKFTVNGDSVERANLDVVQRQISALEKRIAAMSGTGYRGMNVRFRG